MILKSLLVMIGVDVAELEAGLGKVKAKLEAHEQQFRKIGLAMTAVGGVMTAFFAKSIDEAVKSEAAQERLRAALSKIEGASKAGADMLIKYAGALQQTTGIEDEEIMNAERLLATYGLNEKQIAALIPRVLDMAVAHRTAVGGEIDLAGATMTLGRAVTGHMDLLGRQGVVLSEETKRTGDFSLMVKDLDKAFGGAAAAAGQTFAGQMRILKVNIGETMEQIGSRLLPILLPLVTRIGDVVKRVMDWMDAHQGLMKTLVPILAGLGGLMTILGPMVMILPKIVAGVMATAKAFVHLAGSPIGAFVAAIAIAIKMVGDYKGQIELLRKEAELAGQEHIRLIDRLQAGSTAWDKFRALFNPIIAAQNKYIENLQKMGMSLALNSEANVGLGASAKIGFEIAGDSLKKFLDGLGKLPPAYKEITKTIAETPLIGNWGKARQDLIDVFQAWNDAAAVTFSFIGETSKSTVLKLVDDIQYAKDLILKLSKDLQDLMAGIVETGLSIFGDFISRVLEGFMIWGEGHKNILKSMGEAFSGFIKSAIMGVGQLMTSILTASAKEILAEKAAAIAHAIKGVMASIPFPLNLALVGGAIAAVTALFSKIKAFGEGGIVTRPTLAMIGERGPEAILPIGKFGMAAAGAGGMNIQIRQSNFFYGDIKTDYDIDEISEQLARKTQEAIKRGRR